MKRPKILILIMSADTDFFKSQMNDVKNTWIDLLYKENTKNIINRYCEEIDWLYYDSTGAELFSYNIENNQGLITENTGATLDKNDKHHLITTYYDDKFTWHKTYLVLKYLFKENENIYDKYDYVIRTNTSTYINLPLLTFILYKDYNTPTINGINNYELTYGCEIISSIFEAVPKELDIYCRGNCIVLTRYNIKNIILKYGQLYNGEVINENTTDIADDIRIGNLLNSYHNNFNEDSYDYIKYYKALSFNWFKCVPKACSYNIMHKTSQNGLSSSFEEPDKSFYKMACAIQLKNYLNRSLESEYYKELHEKMCQYIYTDYTEETLKNLYNKIKQYSECPSVFLLGNLPYSNLSEIQYMFSNKELIKKFKSYILLNCPSDVWLNQQLQQFWAKTQKTSKTFIQPKF